METVTIALIMLLAVVASVAVVRISPIPLPLPLVQIVIGVLVDVVAQVGVELRPDIFFLLFLPPLLFLDGWRIPKEGLFRDKVTILELALGLVVFTIFGVGFFINWLVPAMPLAVALALAAIISPTDPIAVTAISRRVAIPRRLMHILEGESLLNDASALVCMRFAVAAAVTGAFSLASALGTFLWLATAGITIGIGVTWVIVVAKNWLSHRFGEEPGPQILISLLIPFGAYLLAENLHCSGILAAVSAGITMSYVEQGQVLPLTRIRRSAFWDMIQFTANGVIFVLLGEQLPRLVTSAAAVVHETGHHDPAWLVIYVIAINAALAALRFAWVWTSLRFTLVRAHLRGQKPFVPSWRLIAATSVAGVRGALTLAGVLTLPLTIGEAPFPARDLAIFLAAGVIIMSLVVATTTLPFLLKNLELPPEPSLQEEEDKARNAAAKAAIAAIEQLQHDMADGQIDADLYVNAALRVTSLYRRRIEGRSKSGEEAELAHKALDIERRLAVVGLRAERAELYRSAHNRDIPDELAQKLIREIDLLESHIATT